MRAIQTCFVALALLVAITPIFSLVWGGRPGGDGDPDIPQCHAVSQPNPEALRPVSSTLDFRGTSATAPSPLVRAERSGTVSLVVHRTARGLSWVMWQLWLRGWVRTY